MYAAQLQTAWHNRVYFDPRRTPRHIESFWIKANDPVRHRAIWLRFTIDADPHGQRAHVWAIWIDAERDEQLAIRQTFGIDRLLRDPERAGIGIGESAFDDGGSYGVVRQGETRVEWDFALEDEAEPYYPFPSRWLYTNPFFPKKKLTIGHPCAGLRGSLAIWRGEEVERIDLAGWRAMQGHVWGKKHAERYVWAHCNAFDDGAPGDYVDLVAAQVRVGPVLTPVLTVSTVVVGGRTYRFNTLRRLVGQNVDFRPCTYELKIVGPDAEIQGLIKAEPRLVVGLTYTNPHGKPAYCLNSKLAELSLDLRPKDGPPRKLHSSRAAIEVTQLEPNHGMRMYI